MPNIAKTLCLLVPCAVASTPVTADTQSDYMELITRYVQRQALIVKDLDADTGGIAGVMENSDE